MKITNAALFATCLLLTACAPEVGESADTFAPSALSLQEPLTAETLASPASGSELRVRVGQLTLWVKPEAVAELRKGARVWVIRGRTSRDLAGVSSWVPDDAFGTAAVLTKRTFEVVLHDGSEANTIFSGSPLFLNLETKTSDAHHYQAAIWLAPHFSAFSGSSKLWIGANIVPTYYRDGETNLRYRASVKSTKAATALTVGSNENVSPEIVRESASEFAVLWRYSALAKVLGSPKQPVTLTAHSSATSWQKKAFFEVATAKIGLTLADPRDVWSSPGCSDDVRTCVANETAAELSICGTYREVARCVAEGTAALPPLSEADLDGWLSSAMEHLSPDYTPAFERMLGQGKADELGDAVAQATRMSAAPLVGKTFESPETLLGALTTLAKVEYEKAFAHPMAFVSGSAKAPGSAESARQTAVESMMAYLDSTDLTHTEYAQSLEAVIALHREAWVSGFEQMRTATNALSAEGETFVVTGSVLSSYCEVTVSKTTGLATHVLFEID